MKYFFKHPKNLLHVKLNYMQTTGLVRRTPMPTTTGNLSQKGQNQAIKG